MATSAVSVGSAPAPVAPVAGAGVTAGTGAGRASKEGPSFKDLLAGTEASATPAEDTACPEEPAPPADDGGEDSPPDGNPLPLASPLLPPPEIVAIEALPPANDVATTAPPVTGAAAQPADVDAPALPANVVPVQVAQEDTKKVAREGASAAPVPAPVTQKPTQAPQTTEHSATAIAGAAAQSNTNDTDAAGADAGRDEPSSPVLSLAAQLTKSDEIIDDGTMRRLLASMSGGTAPQSTPPADSATTAAQKSASGTEVPQPVTQPSGAPPVAAASGKETPATAADRLLRELKFDHRVPDGGAQTTTSVAATHAASMQPQAQTAAATAANDTPTLQLQTPMQNRAEWANGLGERISWLTANNQQNAHIHLNPAHLGPIEVQVSVTGDQTTVSFTAHHAATREALEAAAPRLREMLGANGQSSVNVNINHQSPGDRSTQGQPQSLWSRYDGGPELDQGRAVGLPPSRTTSRTRLDTYA